jgi:hypothetical protein
MCLTREVTLYSEQDLRRESLKVYSCIAYGGNRLWLVVATTKEGE